MGPGGGGGGAGGEAPLGGETAGGAGGGGGGGGAGAATAGGACLAGEAMGDAADAERLRSDAPPAIMPPPPPSLMDLRIRTSPSTGGAGVGAGCARNVFFIAGCDASDNELITLEIVHRYVEQMDKYYGNVGELDIIFNFQKAYFILDELLLAGELQESSKKNVLRCIGQQDSLEDMEVSPIYLPTSITCLSHPCPACSRSHGSETLTRFIIVRPRTISSRK